VKATPELEVLIVEMAKRGVSYVEIAEVTGVPRRTVSVLARAGGVSRRAPAQATALGCFTKI